MNKKIETQIRAAYHKLDLGFNTKQWHGYEIHLEPWTLDCFTAAEIAAAKRSEDADHYLEELALWKTNEIAESEKWEGGIYLYPDESQQEYGLSIFYRRAKLGIDKGDLMRDYPIKKYTLEIIGKHIGQRFVPIQEQYRRFKEFRRSRMDGHLVTLGLGGTKDAQGRYSDRERVSIWHPLDPKHPCNLREALFNAGKLQRMIEYQAKATGRFYDVYKAWLKASHSPTELPVGAADFPDDIQAYACIAEVDMEPDDFEVVEGELDIAAMDDELTDPALDPEMATEAPVAAGDSKVPAGTWELTYTGDKNPHPQTELIDVVGGRAEALEKANNFLQANYYDWEIISLIPLDTTLDTGDEIDDLRKSEGYILKDIADAEKRLKGTKDKIEAERIQNTLKLFRKELETVQKQIAKSGITEAKKKEPEFEKEIKAAVARILQQEKFKDILKPISFIVIRPSMPVPEVKLTYYKRSTRHYIAVLEGQLPVPKGAGWILESFRVAVGYDTSGAQPTAKLIGNIHNALLRMIPLAKKMKLPDKIVKYIGEIPDKNIIPVRSMLREWYIKDEPGQFATRLRDVLFRLLPPDWKIVGFYLKGEPTHEKLILENDIYSMAKPMITERLAAINFQDEQLFRRPEREKKEAVETDVDDLRGRDLKESKPGPGKFEGNFNRELAEALYNLSQEGGCADELGGAEGYGWYGLIKDLEELHIKEDGSRVIGAYVSEDNDGFFLYKTFSNAKELNAKWQEIQKMFESEDTGKSADLTQEEEEAITTAFGDVDDEVKPPGKIPPTVWMRDKKGRGKLLVHINRDRKSVV